ncbi:hypothetical protein [Azorhizobium]|uniref:hypothetical protein n=1 Tax=Azorhizobium TaxID=6 RepID=UPI000306453B|nr:hypothetical protein [Azorhizobium]TDT88492.1 hypothetical protein DFO45_4770 [Azorhizobium sp. AG788]
MARPSELSVILIDDSQRAEFVGYTRMGFYLVDHANIVHAGPFRTRAAADQHLDDLWHLPRTG